MRTFLFSALATLFLCNAATAQSKTTTTPAAVTPASTDPLMEEKRILSGELKEQLSLVEAYMGKARNLKAEVPAEEASKMVEVYTRLETFRASLMEQLHLVNAATAANSQKVFANARAIGASTASTLETAKADLTGGSK